MNKKCGKCSKTVYPTEELKCLDKVWHKACFKCQVCNMTLNMKNYKGYDKFPYCNAHYPTTKHTAVADTPESRRIAQNTKIQSNIKYHEQFEKEKGAKISVAEDPELERLKRNTQTVSNVAYHNTLQQKFQQEANRPFEAQDFNAEYNQQPSRRQIGSIADYDPMNAPGYPSQPQQQQQQPRNPALYSPTPYSPPGQFSSKQRQIGSVPGPMSNAGPAPGMGYQYGQPAAPQGSMYVPFRPQEPRVDSQPEQGFQTTYPVPGYADTKASRSSYTNDYQPAMPDVQGSRSSYTNNYPAAAPEAPPVDDGFQEPYPSQYTPPSPPPVEPEPDSGNGFRTSYQPEELAPQPAKQNRGIVSQAMYDYVAADSDEVGFNESDIIINCEPVDDGWMYGTVERTGQRGMLPSNYVERIN